MSEMRNNRRLKVDLSWFIVVEFILCILIIWNTFAERSEYVSLVFACSLVVLLVLFVVKFPRKADALFILLIVIIGLSFLSVVFSWSRNEGELSFDALKNYFLFCSTIICIYLALRLNVNEIFIRRIVGLGVLLSAIFPIGYVWFEFQRFPYFTMNFSNPNLTGMYLLQAVLYAFIGVAFSQHVMLKIMCLVMGIANTVLLYWTEARNGLLSMVLFVALTAWCLLRQKNKLPKYVLAGVAVFPLIFLVLYLLLIDWDVIQVTFDFMVEDGKPLTSRVSVWMDRLGGLEGYYLTGDYFNLGGNAHNSHLVLLTSFGAIVLILTVYYLYLAMKEVNDRCKTKRQLICLLAFCCSLFMGMGEGALFSGGLGLYMMCCTPLIIASNQRKGNY